MDLRFWKLTADGSVDALTVPEALFATERFDKQIETVDRQQRQQHQTMSPQESASNASAKPIMVVGSTGPGVMERQPKKTQLRPTESCIGVGRGKTIDGISHKKRPAACGSDTSFVDQNGPKASGSNASFPEKENHAPPEFDRFGRRINIASSHADRRKFRRLEGPPEGTLITLGWGWGGEFRIGTGRDGFETWPRPLHPDFKVSLT